MGNPAKLRSAIALARRWQRDLKRLEKLYGEYDEDDYSNGAEMQRNLETALSYAEAEATKLKPRS